MKRVFLTLMMSFSIFSLFGQPKQAFQSVDVAEFEKMVADSAYVVLDVRTPEEYAAGHIPGTHFNIDVLSGDYTQEALAKLPKEKPVALYCRSGNRSKTAARILSDNGYNVFELATGIKGWSAAGKAIDR